MERETKIRVPLWIYPSTDKMLSEFYITDNCRSKSEFIEKAVLFYIGYLKEERNVNYLAPMITNAVDAVVYGSERRLSRNLFKIAVELGKLTHMIAATYDIDDATLDELHRMCIDEVRRINGTISFEDAIDLQRPTGDE